MRSRLNLIFLVFLTLWASSSFACKSPLSSEDIREAYFIGARRAVAAQFLEQYTRRFPLPQNGPRIGMIRLETPYAQVVQRAEEALNYYAPDAVQEFLGKPAVFRLRVQIYFTPSYSALVRATHGRVTVRAASFWREFKIMLLQGAEIKPERVAEQPLYSNGEHSRWEGAEVELDYPAAAIRSESAEVEVLDPDGRETTATFDLAQLR